MEKLKPRNGMAGVGASRETRKWAEYWGAKGGIRLRVAGVRPPCGMKSVCLTTRRVRAWGVAVRLEAPGIRRARKSKGWGDMC